MSKGILYIDSLGAWDLLSSDKSSHLVDVRTDAEWNFVGSPNLSSVNKKTNYISWLEYPHMSINPKFIDDLKRVIRSNFDKLLFLCRSGGRSAQAAEYASKCGMINCYNISDGFEGDIEDASKHRSRISGWKYNNLPWEQT